MKQQVTPMFKKPRKQRVAERNKRAVTKREKRPGNDLEYKKRIQKLPCIITSQKYPDPHHLKCMGGRGMGMKAPDKYLVPLNHDDHFNGVERLASTEEEQWFWERGIDCKKLANELWLMRTNFRDMEAVWQKHFDNKDKILNKAKAND